MTMTGGQKREARDIFRRIRRGMAPGEKQKRDLAITQALLQSGEFRSSRAVFLFIGKAIEVDTTAILQACWERNFPTAAPRCVPGTREMEFFWIREPGDLQSGSFGIWEPDPSRCRRAFPDESTLCLVPGLAFDREGYRLGFGKGYYDRFLAHFPGRTVGLCYANCMAQALPRDPFDRRVDRVITDIQEEPNDRSS